MRNIETKADIEKRIILDVIGGVANVWKVPAGVVVEVREYDNGEDAREEGGDYSIDKNGDPYVLAEYRRAQGVRT